MDLSANVAVRVVQSETRSLPVVLKPVRAVVWLSALIMLLGALLAAASLFWNEGGSSYAVTTARGQSVELYGRGVYFYDTLFSGAGFRGTDALTLFLGIPLLAVTTVLYRRGSLRGGLLLLGMLVYFLYVYGSLALGAAYNNLFLGYVALFSASFYGVVLTFTSFDSRLLADRFSRKMPRRGPALFMLGSGLVTLLVWLEPVLTGLLKHQPPARLDSYTTLFTVAVDLAFIVPACLLAGLLILRRRALGYLIAFSLLVLEISLAPMIIAQTISQLSAGVELTAGEMLGPFGGFMVIALLACWTLVALLRNIQE